MKALNELENIDDDLSKEEIVMVRIDDDEEARRYGIEHLPVLVYFEDKLPAIYEGKYEQTHFGIILYIIIADLVVLI